MPNHIFNNQFEFNDILAAFMGDQFAQARTEDRIANYFGDDNPRLREALRNDFARARRQTVAVTR